MGFDERDLVLVEAVLGVELLVDLGNRLSPVDVGRRGEVLEGHMLRGRVVLGGFEDAEHGAGELRAHVLQACRGLLLGLKGADGEEGLGGPDAGSEDGRVVQRLC